MIKRSVPVILSLLMSVNSAGAFGTTSVEADCAGVLAQVKGRTEFSEPIVLNGREADLFLAAAATTSSEYEAAFLSRTKGSASFIKSKMFGIGAVYTGGSFFLGWMCSDVLDVTGILVATALSVLPVGGLALALIVLELTKLDHLNHLVKSSHLLERDDLADFSMAAKSLRVGTEISYDATVNVDQDFVNASLGRRTSVGGKHQFFRAWSRESTTPSEFQLSLRALRSENGETTLRIVPVFRDRRTPTMLSHLIAKLLKACSIRPSAGRGGAEQRT